MPDYATLRNKQTSLIRKALDGSVFVGPISASLVTSLTGAGGTLNALPNKMTDLGWLSTDGAQFSRDVSTSDVTSWGSVSPTRSDITADTTTLTVVCQETKLQTIGLATGADVSGITPASNGEVVIKKPTRPSSRTYRVLSIAVDQGDAGDIYLGRYLPRAKVTAYAEQAFGGGDDPVTWGVTFTSEEDEDAGYAEAWFFGGPGWTAELASMGFTVTP